MVPSVPVLPPFTGTSCNVMVYSLSQSFATRCITFPMGLSLGNSTTKVQLVMESPYPGLKICSKHQQHRPPRMSADKWINLLSSPQKALTFLYLNYFLHLYMYNREENRFTNCSFLGNGEVGVAREHSHR